MINAVQRSRGSISRVKGLWFWAKKSGRIPRRTDRAGRKEDRIKAFTQRELSVWSRIEHGPFKERWKASMANERGKLAGSTASCWEWWRCWSSIILAQTMSVLSSSWQSRVQIPGRSDNAGMWLYDLRIASGSVALVSTVLYLSLIWLLHSLIVAFSASRIVPLKRILHSALIQVFLKGSKFLTCLKTVW